MTFAGRISMTCALLTVVLNKSQGQAQYDPPGVDWHRTFWLEDNSLGTNVSRNQSSEDWTYSVGQIKEGADVVGYVCAGYAHDPNLTTSSPDLERFECTNWGIGTIYCRMYTLDLQGNKVHDEIYGGGVFYKVIHTSDGGFLAVGRTSLCDEDIGYNPYTGTAGIESYEIPCGGQQHAYAVKTDEDLQVEWQYIYGYEQDDLEIASDARTWAMEVVERPNGNFVLLIREGGGPNIVLIIELNDDGTVVGATSNDRGKNKRIEDPQEEYLGRSIQVYDNTKLLVGAGVTGTTEGLILKLDEDFDVIASLAITGASSGNTNIPFQMVRVPSGQYSGLVLASVLFDHSGIWYEAFAGSPASGRVYRINPTGSMSFESFSSQSAPFVDIGHIEAGDLWLGVTATSDEGFATISTRQESLWSNNSPPYKSDCNEFDKGSWNLRAYLTKWDKNGNLLWKTEVETFDELDTDLDDCSGTDDRAQCAKVQGDIKSQECMFAMVETHDGGLLAVGTNSHNFDDDYVIKLYPDCTVKAIGDDWEQGDIVAGISISGSTTWGSKKVLGSVEIVNGGHLTIGDYAVIQFADSRQIGAEEEETPGLGITTNIIVKPGGRLTIGEGAVLRGLIECGTMWDGIQVWGTPNVDNGPGTSSSYGRVFMEPGATIRDARIGIAAGKMDWVSLMQEYGPYYYLKADPDLSGGYIQAIGNAQASVYFIDNRVSVQFFPQSGQNRSVFTRCNFVSNGPLIGSDYMNGDGTFQSIRSFVRMNGVKRPGFSGCNFLQNGYAQYDIDERGIGIDATNSGFLVSSALCGPPPIPVGCTDVYSNFENLYYGVRSLGSHANSAIVRSVIFTDNHRSIECRGTRYDQIVDNEIELKGVTGSIHQKFDAPFAIKMQNVLGSKVLGNTVTNTGGALGWGIISHASNETDIKHNSLDATYAGVQTEWYNWIDIGCNTFDNTEHALSINPAGGGALSAQGEGCNLSDYRPSNNFLDDCDPGIPNHIRTSIHFVYVEDPDNDDPAMEDCVILTGTSGPMTGWTPCGIDFEPTPCPTYSGSGIPTHARAGELLSDLSSASTPEEKNAVLRELMPVLLELDTTQAVIRGALKTAGTETAHRVLAAASYSWGLPDSAFAVLDTMALNNMDDSVFFASYYLLATALDDGRGLLELDSDETDSLLVLAESSVPAAAISQAVLEALELGNYYTMIEQWPSEKKGADDDAPKRKTDAILAYPVPFSDLVVFEFELPEEAHGFLLVADLTGKELHRVAISSSDSRMNVSSANWPQGFYTARIVCDREVIGTVKLVKQ